ncbi:unnamed protein product [marine sediment metagenome]|uniref:HTH cro/C1-type domain-containing protein n=1 Tax=marine sediment metagenome TaxID=412755 RepID=X0WI41_9ZZZZ
MNIIRKLVNKHGISKWRISKELNVSWNTVQNWYKGIYRPTVENQTKLNDLFHKKDTRLAEYLKTMEDL